MLLNNTPPVLTTVTPGLPQRNPSRARPNALLVARESDATVSMPEREDHFELPSPIYDMEYSSKQYGTDALIGGGTIAACAFMFAPEPLVTKIIGGSIAFSCIVAGGLAKHELYRSSYVHKALENALLKLRNEVDTLVTEIKILQAAGQTLEETNQHLQITKAALGVQVAELKFQTQKLEGKVEEAFEQLNQDRHVFEQEKKAKLALLNDEIEEADSRGNRAQARLEALDKRSMALNNIAKELDVRRKALATSENELREMQSKLIAFAVSNPEKFSFRPESPEHVGSIESQTEAGVLPAKSDLYLQQLKVLAILPTYKGAKLRVENDGSFKLQKEGFFSQSIPRSLTANESVRSRENFFRPVFKLFNDSVAYFGHSELQQAFNGLCSMRETYAEEPVKQEKLEGVIRVILVNNPNLKDPKSAPTTP